MTEPGDASRSCIVDRSSILRASTIYELFFDQIAEAASKNESLRKAAEVNSLDKFQLVFCQVLESLFVERMELNEELFTDYMSKPELQDVVSKWLGSEVYDRLGGSKDSIVYPKT